MLFKVTGGQAGRAAPCLLRSLINPHLRIMETGSWIEIIFFLIIIFFSYLE